MTDRPEIERLLKDRLDAIEIGPSIPKDLLHRARKRRRLYAALLGVSFSIIVAVVGIGAFALVSSPDQTGPTRPIGTPADQSPSTPTRSPTGAGTCDYGPWAQHCSEADWVRTVIDKAGFDVVGDTGSAITAGHRDLEFNMWAFPADPGARPLIRAIRDEGYKQLDRPSGTVPVYSDGVRLVWATQGLYVWVASEGPLDEARAQVLGPLVAATNEIFYADFRPDPLPAETADDYGPIYESGDIDIYAPVWDQPFGLCPTATTRIDADDLPAAEEAVLTAVPVLHEFGLGWLDPAGANADSKLAEGARGPPDFERIITKDCGESAVLGTALVTVFLPNVESASLGATTYYVSKELRGWVIWGAW